MVKRLGTENFAFIGLFFTHHHAEERGLPCSVGADEADFLAGVELE